MERLLEQYLLNEHSYAHEIEIKYYNLNGHICEVAYLINGDVHSLERDNISCWEIIVFITENRI